MRIPQSITFTVLLYCLLMYGCADLTSSEGQLQNDLNYLLEEQLHDGEVAAWNDSEQPNLERNLAVFLTCTEEGKLCRYYFTFFTEKGRETAKVFGRSCRKYKRSWQPVHWSPDEDPAMDNRIRSRYQELRSLGTDAPPFDYQANYALPSVLATRVIKAEQHYNLPLRKMIDQTSQKQGLNPVLIHSVVKTESDYNPKATSSVGAIGLMQLMPGTANDLGVNPRDPRENLSGGTRYLRQQLDKPGIQGNVALALASYNAGYGNVKKHGYQVPPYKETRNYVKKIMMLYKSR